MQVTFFVNTSGGNGSGSGELSTYVEHTLTATTNNLDVAGLGSVQVLYLTTTLPLVLTGIKAPSPVKRQLLYVINQGAFSVSMPEESASSTAENRFIMAGTAATLNAQQTFIFLYDNIVSRWRLLQTT